MKILFQKKKYFITLIRLADPPNSLDRAKTLFQGEFEWHNIDNILFMCFTRVFRIKAEQYGRKSIRHNPLFECQLRYQKNQLTFQFFQWLYKEGASYCFRPSAAVAYFCSNVQFGPVDQLCAADFADFCFSSVSQKACALIIDTAKTNIPLSVTNILEASMQLFACLRLARSFS